MEKSRIKFLQHNVNKQAAAHHSVLQQAFEAEITVVLLQEPYYICTKQDNQRRASPASRPQSRQNSRKAYHFDHFNQLSKPITMAGTRKALHARGRRPKSSASEEDELARENFLKARAQSPAFSSASSLASSPVRNASPSPAPRPTASHTASHTAFLKTTDEAERLFGSNRTISRDKTNCYYDVGRWISKDVLNYFNKT
jgi:hypothetical protein